MDELVDHQDGVGLDAQTDARLLMNPSPSWRKYSWFAEFAYSIPKYANNTVETTRLAITARKYMFQIAENGKIEFDLEKARDSAHLLR
ncbi:hypothetical protein ABIF90_007209 [Bradyrhizobium japonicum]